MSDQRTFRSSADVEMALASAALVPPPRGAALQDGPTADLRDSMARFSAPPEHEARRRDVVELIDTFDAAAAETLAARFTADMLRGSRVDVVTEIAAVVPTQVVLSLLGIDGDVSQLVADVRLMAGAIGRGEPSAGECDSAVRRLTERFAADGENVVPFLSVLHQNQAATAALIVATVHAAQTGTTRRSAVAQTVRVAARDTSIGATPVAAGSTVVLDLASSGFEFGSGPHACPGRQLAEAIVAGVVSAIVASGYELVPESAE